MAASALLHVLLILFTCSLVAPVALDVAEVHEMISEARAVAFGELTEYIDNNWGTVQILGVESATTVDWVEFAAEQIAYSVCSAKHGQGTEADVVACFLNTLNEFLRCFFDRFNAKLFQTLDRLPSPEKSQAAAMVNKALLPTELLDGGERAHQEAIDDISLTAERTHEVLQNEYVPPTKWMRTLKRDASHLWRGNAHKKDPESVPQRRAASGKKRPMSVVLPFANGKIFCRSGNESQARRKCLYPTGRSHGSDPACPVVRRTGVIPLCKSRMLASRLSHTTERMLTIPLRLLVEDVPLTSDADGWCLLRIEIGFLVRRQGSDGKELDHQVSMMLSEILTQGGGLEGSRGVGLVPEPMPQRLTHFSLQMRCGAGKKNPENLKTQHVVGQRLEMVVLPADALRNASSTLAVHTGHDASMAVLDGGSPVSTPAMRMPNHMHSRISMHMPDNCPCRRRCAEYQVLVEDLHCDISVIMSHRHPKKTHQVMYSGC